MKRTTKKQFDGSIRQGALSFLVVSVILVSAMASFYYTPLKPSNLNTTASAIDPSISFYTANSTVNATTNGWIVANFSYDGFTFQNDKIRSSTLSGVPTGTVFNLTGLANSGFVFKNWTGYVNSSKRSINLVLDSNAVEVAYFAPAMRYATSFTESGLPSGTTWYVNITGGQSYSSTTSTITADLTNGSYSYTVASSNKIYYNVTDGGTFTVDGSAQTINTVFILYNSTVTFTETGLPSGTTWYVNITGGQSYSSTTSTITADLTNGSYTYSIATTDKIYAPSTVNDPPGDSYVLSVVAMEYVYEPLVRDTVYEDPDIGPELNDVELTYHVVPDGRPVSVNVVEYVTVENVTDFCRLAPLTVNDPVYADGA